MAGLKIIVKNKSKEVQQFLIFNDTPAFSKNAGKAWTNVWGCSPGVGATNGNTKFGIHETYYALFGEVLLGSDKHKALKVRMDVVSGGAVFVKDKATEFDKNGSFGIQTAKYDMTKYEHAFCGMGMKSPVPQIEDVVPVSVWQAKPSEQYHITPKRVFYISTGGHTAGKIVNVAELGTYATVDFTGRKEIVATVVFNNELSYDLVTYSFAQGGDS